LNIVHFSDTNIEQCSNMSETTKMQTLAFEIATTFVDDATALIRGTGLIIVQILTAPIERLANACDVGGVLAGRRFASAMKRQARGGALRPRHSQRCRSYWMLGFLGDLT
jgi:hypothetical protein